MYWQQSLTIRALKSRAIRPGPVRRLNTYPLFVIVFNYQWQNEIDQPALWHCSLLLASAVQIRGLIAITGPEAGLIECYIIVGSIPCLQSSSDISRDEAKVNKWIFGINLWIYLLRKPHHWNEISFDQSFYQRLSNGRQITRNGRWLFSCFFIHSMLINYFCLTNFPASSSENHWTKTLTVCSVCSVCLC